MTQQEMESELGRLRAIEEARRSKWRSTRRTASICAVSLAAAGFGFEVAGLVTYIHGSENVARVLQASGGLFIFISLPMTLLRDALSDPVVVG